MAEPIIELAGLTRRFGKTVALSGLDLQIRQGEIFGLVGPDGAGKTTTMRVLAAVLDPTSGSARLMGYDTTSQAEAIKRRIGYVAQQFSLYGDLSVTENLNFYADVFGLRGRKRNEQIEQLLRFSRLTEFQDRRAAHLSGGMQKKLALACALLHKPQILLLDEPTTGVDPVSRREFWEILTNLHLEGVTVLITTPYMDEADRCTRVGLLYRGRLIGCDTPERIKEKVPGELLELRPIDPVAGTQQGLRRAWELLSGLPYVIEVQSYGDLLHVFVADFQDSRGTIVRALTEEGLEVNDVRQTSPRMEEVFVSLVRRQQAADEAR